MAIVDDGAATTHGFGTGSASTSSARLCAQFCYDPYGSLLSVQGLHAFPDPRTGHKGLHLDRLDAGVADPLTGAPIARHVDPSTLTGGGSSAAGGLTHRYFVRNRHYAPDLGRFMQRDPNAAGLIGHWGLSGEMRRATNAELNLAEHVRSGVGSYQWLTSDPMGGVDPLGLFDLSLVGLLATSSTSSQLQSDMAQNVIETGVSAMQGARDYFGDVALERFEDILWASSWDAADDQYSSGVEIPRRVPGATEAQPDGPAVARRFPWNKLIDHHIATRYGKMGRKFRSMFKSAGMSIDESANIMEVMWQHHKGRGHHPGYHEWVHGQLEAVVKAVGTGNSKALRGAREVAIKAKLEEIKKVINAYPRILREGPGVLPRT